MSLPCAWHCIPTCHLYSNGQSDKALQWHATWLPVCVLICDHAKGFTAYECTKISGSYDASMPTRQ